MKRIHTLAIAAVFAAVVAPLAASATTYTFSIPVQLSSVAPGWYQFICTVGGAAIPAQPGIPQPGFPPTFQVTGTSYSGTASATVSSTAALAHSYDCALVKINSGQMRNPMTGVMQTLSSFSLPLVKVSGTM